MIKNYHPRQKQLQSLTEKLPIPPNAPINWKLLDLALTNPTFSATGNYEQLEFVGDSVVRLASSELLWENYPDLHVGEFAAIRGILVSDRSLARIADSYNWSRYLLVAKSGASDKAARESRLADSFEAVLGALYLSTHSLELIRPWLDPHFLRAIAQIRSDPARQNYKAALQEWTQGRYKSLPQYKVQEANQRHGDRERFAAEVWFQGQYLGYGKGPSIKAAEQAAAKKALEKLAINN